MKIYLVLDGVQERLGFAGAASTTTLTLPWSRVGRTSTLRLLAVPIAEPGPFLSDLLLVEPGCKIELTLEANLDVSSTAVY